MPGRKYPLIIKKLFYQPLYRTPNKEIVYRDRKRYTYVEFYERLQRLANGLKKIGVKPGTTVGVIDWNTNQYLESYFTIPMMGAVLHTINLRLSPEQILYTIDYVKDDFIIIRDEFLPLAEKLASRMPYVKGWIVTGDEPSFKTTLKPVYSYEELIESSPPEYEFPDLDEDTDAAVYFTTGTVGMPKAVRFTHRQIVLQAIINSLAISCYPSPVRFISTDVVMHIAPFFHGLGWTFPYIATLFGCKQVLPGRYEPKVMLELIKNEGVTYTAGVPVFLLMLLTYPEVDKYKDALRGLKFLIDGEHPPRKLFELAMKYGIKMIEAYGMSEGVGYTFATLKDHMVKWSEDKLLDVVNKAGLPAPFVEIKVVDDKGDEVPRDGKTMGEVLVRSPGLITEYWKDPQRTAEAFTKDGWFKTGDVGVVDSEGYLLIVDRIKDVIKSGGEWISSITLEDLISSHPAVNEVAVISVRSERWSERPVAVVVLKPEFEGKVTEEEFKNYLMKFVEAGKIPKWWIPDKFIFEREIPKTSVGKKDKKVLRDKYKSIVLP